MRSIKGRNITLILVLAAILFVGASSLMPVSVYSSGWWFAFWTVIGCAALYSFIRYKLWKRPVAGLLHLSLLLILGGGGLTALTSFRGTLHLRPGQEVRNFVDEQGNRHYFPEPVTLIEFSTDYYPGMSFPRDFRSEVQTSSGRKMDISMNRIGEMQGYRFYQTSFDGEGGSILTVAYDPYGIALTYAGYILFAISGLLWTVNHFRVRRKAWIVMLLPLCGAAEAMAVPAVSAAQGEELASRQVIFRGRIVPYSTVAHEFALKITGSATVGQLSAEQFLASLILYPQEWGGERFIYVKNEALREALGAEGKYISPSSLYRGQEYLPAKLYEDGVGPLDDQILRLDEKIALLSEAWEGTLFTPLAEQDARRRSDFSIGAEVVYNHLQPLKIYFMLTLSAGLLMMLLSIWRGGRWIYPLAVLLTLCAALLYGWLWLITGYIPLASAPQIMQFLSLALLCVTLIAARRNKLLCGCGTLMSGFIALVAWLSLKDPAMTPLMPVLSSPWLTVHVSVVMTAYALLGFTMPAALVALCSPARREELMQLCRNLLVPGVYLLGLGIFLGAVWANQSWGRYWAWDPKETWALVTMLLYALPLHRSLVPQSNKPLFFLLLILAFLSIIMTYCGVNYLSSLHAYQ